MHSRACSKQPPRLDGQQLGIARPGADKIDFHARFSFGAAALADFSRPIGLNDQDRQIAGLFGDRPRSRRRSVSTRCCGMPAWETNTAWSSRFAASSSSSTVSSRRPTFINTTVPPRSSAAANWPRSSEAGTIVTSCLPSPTGNWPARPPR